MRRTTKQIMARRRLLRRLIGVAVMVAVLVGAFSQSVFAQNSYIITDGDSVTVHKSYSTDPAEILDEAGIELSEEDTYTTTYNDGINRITVQRLQMVTVIYRGSSSVIGTYGETVKELLERMGLSPAAGDVLSCDVETVTYDGLVVEIVQKQIEILEHDEVIPFETNYYEDPELAADEELVLTEGADGTVHYKTRVVYENGAEVSREVLQETVTQEPVDRVVIRGVPRTISEQPDGPEHVMRDSYAASAGNPEQAAAIGAAVIADGTITTNSGLSYTYTDEMTVLATAYSCGDSVGITATGTIARVGAIAVDPRVIPLGTKMYIVSEDGQYVYGYCTAEDTGGLIKGYRVDLYFETIDECWDFGVRNCKLYILE